MIDSTVAPSHFTDELSLVVLVLSVCCIRPKLWLAKIHNTQRVSAGFPLSLSVLFSLRHPNLFLAPPPTWTPCPPGPSPFSAGSLLFYVHDSAESLAFFFIFGVGEVGGLRAPSGGSLKHLNFSQKSATLQSSFL